MIYVDGDFSQSIVPTLHNMILHEAPQVDTGHWQSLNNVPHTATRELFRVCMETPIPTTPQEAALWGEPNLPWAEDHFQERVGGEPTNPGRQYMNWPWYDPNWKAQKVSTYTCLHCETTHTGWQKNSSTCLCGEELPPFGEAPKFSHTYQERMWPRFANVGETRPNGRQVFVPHNGIRYEYGDLNDLVSLLVREPTTRQAYLPIWFPEDTGAHHGERVPCTLGYHFILRGGLLHCTYHIRSCDFLRYFRDDVYMAMRLTQWMLGALTDEPHPVWDEVSVGILQMNITSLHIFEGDMPKMRREAP